MKKVNGFPEELRVLTDDEIAGVSGGWHPFPSGIFGRDGQPFFGKDFIKYATSTAVKNGVSMIPGVGPIIATGAGIIAGAIVANNTK